MIRVLEKRISFNMEYFNNISKMQRELLYWSGIIFWFVCVWLRQWIHCWSVLFKMKGSSLIWTEKIISKEAGVTWKFLTHLNICLLQTILLKLEYIFKHKKNIFIRVYSKRSSLNINQLRVKNTLALDYLTLKARRNFEERWLRRKNKWKMLKIIFY